mmetsp:Transcript_29722/g.78921  ORF Transcript_29722/g.78921 Transcript_29722/m.78921 type:complete len:521 (-) Transcript_29722:134-1696(-)
MQDDAREPLEVMEMEQEEHPVQSRRSSMFITTRRRTTQVLIITKQAVSQARPAISRAMTVGLVGLGGGEGDADRVHGLLKQKTSDNLDVTVGLSETEACCNLVIALVGVAVTTFPIVVSRIGYVASPFVLFSIGALVLENGRLICQSCDYIEAHKGLQAGEVRSFETLAFEAMGPLGKVMLSVTKNAVMLGTIVVFVSFITDSICTFVPSAYQDVLMTPLRFLVVMPLFMALGMLTDLKQLAKFAPLGLVGVFSELSGILLGSGMNIGYTDMCDPTLPKFDVLQPPRCRRYRGFPEDDSFHGMLAKVGVAMSVFLYGFAILPTLPGMRATLNEPKAMSRVILISFTIAIFAYFVVTFDGYFSFGQKVKPNVVVGISDSFPRAGKIPVLGLILNVVFSVPIFLIVLMSAFESGGTGALYTPLSTPNIMVRCALIFVLTLVSWSLPYVNQVVGLISSVFCVCNNLFFPVLFFYMVRGKAEGLPPLPKYRVVLHVLIMVCGMWTMVFGFTGNLAKLMVLLRRH